MDRYTTEQRKLAKQIGQSCKAARKQLEMTQADVAERVGITRDFYGNIERGVSLPALVTFLSIVRALGVTAEALAGTVEIVATAKPPEGTAQQRRVTRLIEHADSSTLRLVEHIVRELEQAKTGATR